MKQTLLGADRLERLEAQLREEAEAAGTRRAESSGPALERVGRDDVLPLSFAQQRLWFLDQFEPGNTFYNVAGVFHLSGPLEVSALGAGLDELVRRHESLRTTFPAARDGQPAQLVADPLPLPLPLSDLSALAPQERTLAERRLITDEARRPFDLSQGPLVRAALLRLADTEHVLMLNLHHIICDGWSMGILFRELAVLYEAAAGGEESHLPEPSLQYADFAHWQRRWLSGEVLEGQLAYWRERLEGAPAVLELPADRPRPAAQSFRGAGHSFELPFRLSEGLKTLSRREGATLFMTLLAGFQALLARYTSQEDIVVGTPIANRTRSELEGLVGFFVNTLVLRTDTGGDPTFGELLRRVREVTLGAYAHQDVPFEKLVEELRPERDLSHTPIFQVMFALQNAPRQELKLSGLTLRSSDVTREAAKFDLTLVMYDTEQGLNGWIGYKTDLFEAETIARMMKHFETLLRGIVDDPDRRLSELPLLTQAQERRLLAEWNDSGKDYRTEVGVHRLFEARAEATPDRVAVVFEDERLTYGELNQRANRVAHRLRRLGVGPEVIVGLCVERSCEMLVGMLGVLKAGGAYLPLDPALPKERLAFMLTDARARVLLTQQHLVETLPEHAAQTLLLDADWELTAGEGVENPAVNVAPGNLCYVIYTSGSTGAPKGTVVEHRQLLNYTYAVSERLDLPQHSSYAIVSTFAADLGNTVIYPALCSGGELHVISRERASDADALADYFSRRPVDCLKIVPSHLEAVQVCPHPEQLMPRRRLVLGGEASRSEWIESLKVLSPECTILNHYGPTETTVGVLTHRVARGGDEPAGELLTQSGTLPLGRPIANLQVYVLDAHLRPVPVGVPGEMYIGGAGLTRGYLNRPGLTAEKFIPHPHSAEPGARLYRPGDLARQLPDGSVEFLGRTDQQVKFHGYRVELNELRGALNRHAQVRDSVVRMSKDKNGGDVLVAYYVSRQQLEVSELRDFMSGSVAEEVLPNVFVQLKKMPLNLNGKINYGALPSLDEARESVKRDFVAPRSAAEELVAGIWSDVLGVERISVNDNFFELGGHSLLATRVISRLREAFQVDIPLRRLFERPTVEGLVAVITQIWGGPEVVEEIARTVREVEQLSPEMTRQMLAEESITSQT